ncbi:MAG: hypothetical protein HY764_00995 [Candidatus Portnoybacteria bacterium]|nr:hypothetical protein [Candidatus Portnoybacteria bacterium]
MDKHSLIRTFYLYTFALLGLVLLTIGGIRFIDMGLKAFVFTKAEDEERVMYKEPFSAPIAVEKLQDLSTGAQTTLSESEKANIQQWLVSYNQWKEQRSNVDPVTSRRQRDASFNLAMILVGLPLYLYHWIVIKKESKNKNA